MIHWVCIGLGLFCGFAMLPLVDATWLVCVTTMKIGAWEVLKSIVELWRDYRREREMWRHMEVSDEDCDQNDRAETDLAV